jgi:hypothetical protein
MALTLALAIGTMVPTPADADVARRTRIVAADGNCSHIPPEFAAIEGAYGTAMIEFVLRGPLARRSGWSRRSTA